MLITFHHNVIQPLKYANNILCKGVRLSLLPKQRSECPGYETKLHLQFCKWGDYRILLHCHSSLVHFEWNRFVWKLFIFDIYSGIPTCLGCSCLERVFFFKFNSFICTWAYRIWIICKQIYLTYRWDPNVNTNPFRVDLRIMAKKGTIYILNSSSNKSLTIRCSLVPYPRDLFLVGMLLCKGTVNIF